MWKRLSANRQIICITHQPQIAGKADAHFYVYKQVVGDTVKTNIKILSKEERITTIAQMLSGEKPTPAALENAKEMVGDNIALVEKVCQTNFIGNYQHHVKTKFQKPMAR